MSENERLTVGAVLTTLLFWCLRSSFTVRRGLPAACRALCLGPLRPP